jgi:hypothetical protein
MRHWRLTKLRLKWLLLASISLLLYEFVGRPWYRPWVKKEQLNDWHIADTLGNTLGTCTTISCLLFLFAHDRRSGIAFVWIGTIGVLLFELMHPLLGKPMDGWDLVATSLTGLLMWLLVRLAYPSR